MAKVVAIIMAGGQGSRLYPLTKMRSKPAVPIAGRFRLIDIPISNCIHSGYRRHLRPDPVRQRVAPPPYLPDLPVRYLPQGFRDDPLRPADHGEPRLVPGHGRRRPAEPEFLRKPRRPGPHPVGGPPVPHGLPEIRRFSSPVGRGHQHLGPSRCAPSRSTDFGVMKVDRTGPDRRIPGEAEGGGGDRGHARRGRGLSRAHGIDARRPDALGLDGHLSLQLEGAQRSPADNSQDEDFGRQVIPAPSTEQRSSATSSTATGRISGRSSSFFEANLNLTEPLPQFNFYDEERPIFTHARFLPGSKILASTVENSILCEGSIINCSRIRRSIIGIRSRIGENCDIERTVMMGADYLRVAGRARERTRPAASLRSASAARCEDPRRHHRQERPHRERRQAHQRPGRSGRNGRQLLHRQRDHCRSRKRRHPRRDGHLESRAGRRSNLLGRMRIIRRSRNLV